MKTSIIIPNYFMGKPGRIVPDGDEEFWFAEHCFERLKKFTSLPYELILVDNGSVGGKELLRDNADVLVTNKENLGFAKGCNQGFKLATGDWICCMNNDIFVWEGWLEALIEVFDKKENCGVSMPALFREERDARKVLEIDKIDLSKNHDKFGEGAEFGSCWLTKKSILDKVGLFDENFKVGFGEDRDLWRRMRRDGYETYRTHNTRVFHQGNVTMSKITERTTFTFPNRAYLKQIRELEVNGKILNDEEKKNIKEEIEKDYKKNWDSNREYLKEKWGY